MSQWTPLPRRRPSTTLISQVGVHSAGPHSTKQIFPQWSSGTNDDPVFQQVGGTWGMSIGSLDPAYGILHDLWGIPSPGGISPDQSHLLYFSQSHLQLMLWTVRYVPDQDILAHGLLTHQSYHMWGTYSWPCLWTSWIWKARGVCCIHCIHKFFVTHQQNFYGKLGITLPILSSR